MAYTENSTFEGGQQGWTPLNLASSVFINIVQNGTARSGRSFLRAITSQRMGSIALDFSLRLPTPPSLCALAYVRAAPAQVPVPGIMKFWNLSVPSRLDENDTRFVATGDWTLVMCAIDIPPTANPLIRLEFYIDTVQGELEIDTVSVF